MAEILELYSQVVLLTNLPSEHLEKGDVGTIVDIVTNPKGNKGYALEFFDHNGNTVAVTVVAENAIGALPRHSIMHIRKFQASSLRYFRIPKG